MFGRRPDRAPEIITDRDCLGGSSNVSHVSVRVGDAKVVRIAEKDCDISQLRRADCRIRAEDVGKDLVDRAPIGGSEVLLEEAGVARFPGRVGELQRLVECGDD